MTTQCQAVYVRHHLTRQRRYNDVGANKENKFYLNYPGYKSDLIILLIIPIVATLQTYHKKTTTCLFNEAMRMNCFNYEQLTDSLLCN